MRHGSPLHPPCAGKTRPILPPEEREKKDAGPHHHEGCPLAELSCLFRAQRIHDRSTKDNHGRVALRRPLVGSTGGWRPPASSPSLAWGNARGSMTRTRSASRPWLRAVGTDVEERLPQSQVPMQDREEAWVLPLDRTVRQFPDRSIQGSSRRSLTPSAAPVAPSTCEAGMSP